ncbi:helix-turn-helix domain-containing protein [Paludibacterium purpuratum]|uniref:Xre family transcriptional regulator n=1 Tax=Paludibacterium purpuratum TaxID=1144873 RepID=A0A4R7AWY4_9NEIS|nr:XRE family transcriptional regulator [Paludibacterium purpuratum]TDR72050.1 Xre family transcriptional regulator [Paludibacterium purpuratum]
MSDQLTPAQTKAARALLAWSQQELAAHAHLATSTVADLERGQHTSIHQNAHAIREALEAQGLKFVAGGVVEKDMLSLQPLARPGALMRWINATHLSQWCEQREGQSSMPELIRRLIFATVGPAAKVRFPSDESVQYAGLDGACTSPDGTSFVPEGESAWEIGTQRTKITTKANGDFAKRTADPLGKDQAQTTFVFVTPQRFTGKDAWVSAKRKESPWLDVRAIDGDDLVHWLEMCPAVALWLATKIGRRPQGLRNLEEFWSEWTRATRPPLTHDILLTNRDQTQAAISKWLRSSTSEVISLQAEAPDEAIAFFYSSLCHFPENYRLHYLSQCVVADNADTARALIGLGTPLIIVLIDPEPGLAQRLVEDGHRVLTAHGPNAHDLNGNLLSLPKPWRSDLQNALMGAGLPEDDAHRLARASGRSITILRRLMPAAPNYRPKWAEQPSSELIAAMLAGSWREDSEKDRKILSDLASRSYEQIEEALAPLAATMGGPLVRSGMIWKVVSLRDLWLQIGGQLTPSQLTRFKKAFHDVMSTINPRFTQKPKSIFYEAPGEFGEEISGALRRGITEAMIAMATLPTCAKLICNIEQHAYDAIHTLLDSADGSLWWSLSGDFRNLAEASPTAFLDALDIALESNATIMPLFRSDEGALCPTEYLANLLWALEMLARSPDYLYQSTSLLARLAEIDPGGKLGNRPAASLRRIFVSWSPQTYATPAQRLKVIASLVHQFPTIGWNLLLGLAPRSYDTSEPSAMPNWLDFAPDEEEVVTWQTAAVAAKAIGELLLGQVGNSTARWHSILDLWPNFDPQWRSKAIEQLKDTALMLTDATEIEMWRNKLRTYLQHHRDYQDTEWALPEEDLKQLDEVMELLPPENVEEQVRWLFSNSVNKLRPNIDWEAQQSELAEQRRQAIETLLADYSSDQLFSFATTIAAPRALGIAIATSSQPEATKLALIKRGLSAGGAVELELGLGIFYGLKVAAGSEGDTWVRTCWAQAIAESWGESAENWIVQALPLNTSTWSEIDARSANLSKTYWETLPLFLASTGAEPAYVVEHLVAAKRSHEAISWLGMHLQMKPDSALVIRCMQEAARSGQSRDNTDTTMLSHYVALILDYLAKDNTVDRHSLVQLEWMYYPALCFSQRGTQTLHRALAQEPEFFVQLIKLIYLPTEASSIAEEEPHNPDILHQAYSVIRDWACVPGEDDQGIIDPVALKAWITRARELLTEAGRRSIGDKQIGEALSAAKSEPNQPWPPTPVRDVIELFRSRDLEVGFERGVYSRRGVTVRMPHDGGMQERALAARYRHDAEVLRNDWPRMAACLERIAASYDDSATRADLRAEQGDW